MPYFVRTFDAVTILVNQAATPGAGWLAIGTVQGAFDKARIDGRPLFIRPGVYPTTEITVTTVNGGGAPLSVGATPGTVALQLTSGANLVTVRGVASCEFRGLIFDGANVDFANLRDSSALLRIDDADSLVTNCTFRNSARTGIYATGGAKPRIVDNHLHSCSHAIWSFDATSYVNGNAIENCGNNGVMIHRSTVASDGSIVTDNTINTIESGSGTGQNGNGVQVFRAMAVIVSNNQVSNCAFSAIRCNGGSAIVSGNSCFNSRETAIFIEAPGSGVDFHAGVVSGNHVSKAGCGILVVNSGYYGDGVARLVSVTGNMVNNIVRRPMDDPGYAPPLTIGAGIMVEGACVVSANILETIAGPGIVAGTNEGAQDLNINGNTILNANIGIGWSNHPGAGQVSITGNMVRNAPGGGIVPISFDGSNYLRVKGGADYGNQKDAQIANAFIGNNRAY